MRLLHMLSQSVLWMAALIALILVDDLTTGSWAPLALIAAATGASLAISRAFPESRVNREPQSFFRPHRSDGCDYASHAAMSPGMGGIQR